MQETGRTVRSEQATIGGGSLLGNGKSAINVIRAIIEDDGNVLYLPGDPSEERGCGCTSGSRRALRPLTFVSDWQRFNFSVRCIEIATGKFRTFAFIRDGEYVHTRIKVGLTPRTFLMLQSRGIIPKLQSPSVPSRLIDMNFTALQKVSPTWANPKVHGLVPLMKKERRLRAALDALENRVGRMVHEEERRAPQVRPEMPIPAERFDVRCVQVELADFAPRSYDFSAMDPSDAERRAKKVRRSWERLRFRIRLIIFALEKMQSQAIPWSAPEHGRRGKDWEYRSYADFDGAKLVKIAWEDWLPRS